MGRMRLVLISLAGLILAGALGYGVYRQVQPLVAAPACDHSQAADLALNLAADPATQRRVQELDAAFGAQFSAACDQLCADRAKLSEKLVSARADDPEVASALERIHGQQARMEVLTWNHIIAVRDLLPEGQRADYVRKVQADWARGQARLRSAAAMGQCQMEKTK